MWNLPIETYIKNNKNNLDKKIGKYLIELDSEIFNTNLMEVAKNLDIAASTVTKFLKKCGYEGWKIYTTFAYISMNRKLDIKKSFLINEKENCYQFIEVVFSKILKSIAQKMNKASKVILAGHQSTKEYLRIFERNIRIIGKEVNVVDISDKYYQYPDKVGSLIMVFSFSGKNSNMNFLNNIMMEHNLSTKVFISPSHESYSGFNYNITLKSKKYLFSHLERALPIVKISYVQHCLDIILMELMRLNQSELNEKFKKIGIQKRLVKKN